MKKVVISSVLLLLIHFCQAQYNYFNFTTSQLNSEASTGEGIVVSPNNEELFYRSSYGYMCYANGANYNTPYILWGTQQPKTTSEFVYGDNRVFYVDINNRLRMLYFDGPTNTWLNYELNYNAPAASGTGLVFVGNSTLYYTAAQSPYLIYKISYSNATTPASWLYESTGVTSKINSRIAYGNNQLIYFNSAGRICTVYKPSQTWLTSELNQGSPTGSGTGLVYGDNSNVYYTTSSGNICDIYFDTQSPPWNFNIVWSAVNASSGSKLLYNNNSVYYVGSDGYMYSLIWDNCDWVNKKINKTAQSKPESIYFGANQIFYRDNSDNKVYSAKSPVTTTQPYVYVKGKTFYENNQPFYPVVMNYNLNLNSTGDSLPDNLPDLWVSPDHQIFPLNICDAMNQTEANVYLRSDFARLKSLGFNTLRLVSMEVLYNETGSEESKINILKAPNANNWFQVSYNNNKTKLFNAISNVLTLADEAGLKVILLTGGGYIQRDNAFFNYATFLNELADNFQSNPAILAYDLCNEPGNTNLANDKQSICFKSKTWYDTIRAVDKNHLVTMGLYGRDDMIAWDPNIISVDFHSFHLYNWSNISNLFDYEQGIASQMKWVQNNIRIPWIVGETTHSAIDNNIDNGNTNCNPNYVIGYATETEQQQYAQYTQIITRGFGGSGYSWWAYHDITHDSNISPSEAFEGIYTLCDRKKPVADEFNENTHNWLSYSCNNSPTPDDKYYYKYDPNETYAYIITGKLIDNNGSPIKDGYIFGRGSIYGVDTYSKSDGTFKLCSNNPLDVQIQFTALGKVVSEIWYPYGNPASLISYKDVGDIVLQNVPSCTISSNVRLISSIKEKTHDINVDVYPNPANNYIIVQNNFVNKFKVEMYDVLGKLILSNNYEANSNVKIECNDIFLTNNFVIVKIFDNNTSISKKVLIIK